MCKRRRRRLRKPTAMRRVERPDLDRRAGAADLLVVTTGIFREPIAPLIEHRRKQGYRVEVVDVENIFLTHGAGMPTPSAVRAFCADVFQRWARPAPARSARSCGLPASAEG